jgi:methyl-accepting chemotaxis protein
MDGKEFTKTSNWKRLKEVHANVHGGVQGVINNNASSNIQEMMDIVAGLDNSVLGVFQSIQEVKTENHDFTSKNTINNTPVVLNTKPEEKTTTKSLNKVESSNDEDEWASF